MRLRAIACDGDGILAEDGRVAPETVDVAGRGRASGRKLILIVGRALDDVRMVFSELTLFKLVVAENSALPFDPALRSEQPLCGFPSARFLRTAANDKRPFQNRACTVCAKLSRHFRPVFKILSQATRLATHLEILRNQRPEGNV